jgi:hypothetical protein
MSSILYTIPHVTRAKLPSTFHHTDRYLNHYGSNVSSTRWGRVRIRAPDSSLGSLLGQIRIQEPDIHLPIKDNIQDRSHPGGAILLQGLKITPSQQL